MNTHTLRRASLPSPAAHPRLMTAATPPGPGLQEGRYSQHPHFTYRSTGTSPLGRSSNTRENSMACTENVGGACKDERMRHSRLDASSITATVSAIEALYSRGRKRHRHEALRSVLVSNDDRARYDHQHVTDQVQAITRSLQLLSNQTIEMSLELERLLTNLRNVEDDDAHAEMMGCREAGGYEKGTPPSESKKPSSPVGAAYPTIQRGNVLRPSVQGGPAPSNNGWQCRR